MRQKSEETICVDRSVVARAAFVLKLAIALSGCAFTTGHVDVAYQPDTSAARIAGAESRPVAVDVTDKRTSQVVGQKINGFGMKTADIVSDSDVPATVKGAFETELQSRGFKVASGGDVIDVELSNFQSQFKVGFVSGDAIANVGLGVILKRPDGSVAFNKYVTGQGKDWVEIADATNAQHVLGLALQDAVSKVFNDPEFIDALKKH